MLHMEDFNLGWMIITIILIAVLHELTHICVVYLFKGRISAFFITKKSIGFLVRPDEHILTNRRLISILLAPQTCTLVFLFQPSYLYLLFFPIVNVIGGLGDIITLKRLLPIGIQERVERIKGMSESLGKGWFWEF